MNPPPIKHYLPVPETQYINKYKFIPEWPFRMLICGSSGSGKTNLLLNLILQYLDFDSLIIYAKDLSESKYVYLQELFKDEENVLFSSSDKIISVDTFDANMQNLIVFDDYLTMNKQTDIEEIFLRGRKKGVSVIYLTQSYYKTPKNLRLQCNYLVLFKSCNNRELSAILRDHTLEDVKEKYRMAVKKPYDFFMIDFKNSDLKYRHNFNPIYKKE
jgi:hypothetical protein